MKAVVLDAEMRAKLGSVTAKITLTDETGKVVGHYVPDDLYCSIRDTIVPPHEEDRRAAALEELRRSECLTTAEMLARMRENLRRWTGEDC